MTYPGRRPVRVFAYSPWADRLADAAGFLAHLPGLDLAPRVADPSDARLMRMARLDCDWHGENVRVFSELRHADLEFLPAAVLGNRGLTDLVAAPRPEGEDWWLILIGQTPRAFQGIAGRMLAFLTRQGVRILYYAFDEASRQLAGFPAIAPHLDVLIHDEDPLAPAAAAALRPTCLDIHRSWVANVVPFSIPFEEAPEEKILFLGSELGYTPHRRRQVEFLQARFGERVVAIHDHSVPVSERGRLKRFKVGFCPEGRMFTTPGMRASHTDRPFWSGCLGLVPVCEDSRYGGRLEDLHRAGLIRRYAHGDLDALARACDEALALSAEARRRSYDYFNRHETVGRVVADAIAEASASRRPAGIPAAASLSPCLR